MSEKGKVLAEVEPKGFITFFNFPKKEAVPKNVDKLIDVIDTIILDQGLRSHISKQKNFKGASRKDIKPGNFIDISIVEVDEEDEDEQLNTYRFKIIRYEDDDLKLQIYDPDVVEEAEEEEYFGDDVYQAIQEIELEQKKDKVKKAKSKGKKTEEEEVIEEEEDIGAKEEKERKRQKALEKYITTKSKPKEEEIVIERFRLPERIGKPLVTENERFIEDLPWIRCLSCGKVIAKTWEQIRLLIQNHGLIVMLLRAIKRNGIDGIGDTYDQVIFKLGKEMGIQKAPSEKELRKKILEELNSRFDLDFVGKLDLNDDDLMGKLLDHYGINRMCCRTYILFPSKISTATTSENVKTEELLLRNKKEESPEEERATQDILKKVGLLRDKKSSSIRSVLDTRGKDKDDDKPSKKTVFGKKAI